MICPCFQSMDWKIKRNSLYSLHFGWLVGNRRAFLRKWKTNVPGNSDWRRIAHFGISLSFEDKLKRNTEENHTSNITLNFVKWLNPENPNAEKEKEVKQSIVFSSSCMQCNIPRSRISEVCPEIEGCDALTERPLLFRALAIKCDCR